MTAPVFFFCNVCQKVVQDVAVSQPDAENLRFALKCHGKTESHDIRAFMILGDPHPLWSTAFTNDKTGPEYQI